MNEVKIPQFLTKILLNMYIFFEQSCHGGRACDTRVTEHVFSWQLRLFSRMIY